MEEISYQPKAAPVPDEIDNETTCQYDVPNIFDAMNDRGCRSSATAYYYYKNNNNTEWNHGKIQISGGNSILAPAPLAVYPEGSGAGSDGTGYIIFDANMDTEIDASSALTYYVWQGDLTLDNFHWKNNHCIEFDYHDGSENFCVTITAHYDLLYSDGGQMLDGDCYAPNGQDKVWDFSNY